MKNVKKQTETKAKLKELALEKLRKTEGGKLAIVRPFDTTFGMILPDPFKNLR